MENFLNKPISFLLFVAIGLLLRKKISAGDETNGLKSLILSIILPATIFIALLKIKIDSNLILFPALALGLNLLLLALSPLLLLIIGIDENSPSGRSAKLLIPSLAPGLSCFPFILEFLGDTALANAAMADLGNKFFVLFLLYLLAVKWHYKKANTTKMPLKSRLKSLLLTLLYEPVNLFIFVALILVSFNISLDSLPSFLGSTLSRLSAIMTPLVLIFIGLAVKLKKKQFFEIFSLLILRAAFTLLLVSIVVFSFDLVVKNDILVLIAFSLSACSFWPYAHISGIDFKERKREEQDKTFNANFAISILALSLPISVLLVLGILTANTVFVSVPNLLSLSLVLFSIGIIYPVILKLRKSSFVLKKKQVLE
ncbi:AEC family transporter [Algibacter pacificus]|uniref:permease n=1 Tax=Algibacter pacificus TaxID=2599389 RepID=UPI0011C8B2D9|nr:permease [Algibacter pacificus]